MPYLCSHAKQDFVFRYRYVRVVQEGLLSGFSYNCHNEYLTLQTDELHSLQDDPSLMILMVIDLNLNHLAQ